jgi:hypothetical protein
MLAKGGAGGENGGVVRAFREERAKESQSPKNKAAIQYSCEYRPPHIFSHGCASVCVWIESTRAAAPSKARRAFICPHTGSCALTDARTHTGTHTRTREHTRPFVSALRNTLPFQRLLYTHTHTHTYTHTHTQTHIHTHVWVERSISCTCNPCLNDEMHSISELCVLEAQKQSCKLASSESSSCPGVCVLL